MNRFLGPDWRESREPEELQRTSYQDRDCIDLLCSNHIASYLYRAQELPDHLGASS